MRKLTFVLGFLYGLIMLIIQLGISIIHISGGVSILIAIPFISLYLYMYVKIKSGIKKIKTIGEIEFTTSCIRKKIGDSVTEYNFGIIDKIELQKHIPNANKTRYFSHILTIIFKNSSVESLVISDKPSDSHRNLSVLDTMNTLKKITNTGIKIS